MAEDVSPGGAAEPDEAPGEISSPGNTDSLIVDDAATVQAEAGPSAQADLDGSDNGAEQPIGDHEPGVGLVPLPAAAHVIAAPAITVTTPTVKVPAVISPDEDGFFENPNLVAPVRGRLTAMYAGLALVGGFLLTATVLFAVGLRPVTESGPAWSSFRPAGDGIEKARAIAEYVAPRYRADDGSQLVAVQADNPTVENAPVAAIAVFNANQEMEPLVPVGNNAVAYMLCGLGENCAIRSGEVSLERGRLVRRQAAELALYTFRYMKDRDTVVVFMPAQKGSPPKSALMFRRSGLAEELSKPLDQTLPSQVPAIADLADGVPEAETVDRLTNDHTYLFSFQKLQNGAPALVLDVPAG